MSSRFPPQTRCAPAQRVSPLGAGANGPALGALYPGIETALAALLTLLVFGAAHFASLTSPLVINDDVRQQLFWTQRWQDPALYPPDLLNAYARAYVPWGVQALYRLGALVMNPVQCTKVVTAALFVLQGLAVMGIGRFFGGRALAWGALAFVWGMPFFLDNISGGLSRAFASPSLAALVLAWLVRDTRLALGALAVQALCIPYIFAPCALAVAAERFRAWLGCRPGFLLNTRFQAALLALCALVVLGFSLAYSAKGFGPLVSLAEAVGRPEFGPKGRLDLVPLPHPFLDFVYFPFEGVGLFKEWGLLPGILTLALLAGPVGYGALRLPWRELGRKAAPLAWLGLAFLLFYVAARMLAFSLFVPDRYVQYPVNLLYGVLLPACLVGAWRARPRAPELACLAVALAAVFGALRLKDVGLYDLREHAGAYRAVAALTPVDALIAGHPEFMDNVLTFSRRNAWATFELSHCWSVGFWKRLEPRLTAFFEAYYAEDPEVVRRFASQGADFLVVQAAHFTPDFLAATPYFEPFGQAIRTMTAARTHFAVLDEASFPRIPLGPGIFLVDLRPWRSPGAKP